MKNVTGIWIDKRTAKIVTIQDGSEDFHTIDSSIEEFHPGGGSGTRVKGGPQDVVQDSKFTEREKQQEKRFFQSIMDQLKSADNVVIFGPAEMGQKLHSEISNSNAELHKKVSEVKSADSMTDNQVKAWVRDYFNQ